jgi:hypothetical protein
MSIEAMRQALEVWDAYDGGTLDHPMAAAMEALRAAIEQAEKQEPVAWVLQFIDDDDDEEDDDPVFEIYESERRCRADAKRDGGVCKPLYLTPHQRQWVGLTEEEIFKVENAVPDEVIGDSNWCVYFAKAIEAKLKEKNETT